MKLELITYGCGKKFDIKKFKPVENRDFIKPRGGLWASPVNSNYGWYDWCTDNDYGNLSNHFKFTFNGNVYVIDSVHHLSNMPWVQINEWVVYPDFEKMVSWSYDAIWLTEKGQTQTRFSQPSLYGWDCETVLIMNPYSIEKLNVQS